LTLQIGGGLGLLAGVTIGLLAGPALVLGLPWSTRFAEDPVVTVLVLTVQLVIVLAVSLGYVVLGVALEPFRLRLAGARRLSRREAEYLLPILHDCARRLGVDNVPRLVVDDGREPNALAYTRHIVVYRGLLTEFKHDRDVVASILSHELVHWHNADGVARLTLRGIALPVYLVYAAATWLMRVGDNAFIRFLTMLVSWPVLASVRFLIVPVQSAGAREAEYRADQGAVVAGQLPGLRRALERFQRSFDSSRNGWDRAICASHPPAELRLERLEQAGEPYPLLPGAEARRAANPA
ncbi:MAG: M48 family metalloprotease, partial [Natronosporangium sp.]